MPKPIKRYGKVSCTMWLMAASLIDIHITIKGCIDCPLRDTCIQTVPGSGSGLSRVMFVGEAPGAVEDNEGDPFMGPSGELLRGMVAEVGIEDAFYTNVLKCRPPNNRDPKQSEIDACLHYLDEQILTLEPKVIVTVGRYAMVQFMPDDSIMKVHGIPHIVHGRIVLPIIHTAMALRQPEVQPAIMSDLRLIPRLLDTPINAYPDAKLTIL